MFAAYHERNKAMRDDYWFNPVAVLAPGRGVRVVDARIRIEA